MAHIQLTIAAEERDQEILIARLADLQATGFEQQPQALLVYFDEPFDRASVLPFLEGFSWQEVRIEEQNWNAVWESAFEPVSIGFFCAIRAHFHPPMEGYTHELLITPKMSFGTGHHATTHLMVEAMKGIRFNGAEVFDFGTGTGVLAILAERMGAARVLAMDVDDWSIENAGENAALNGCRRIQIIQGSAPPAGSLFDVVLANINRHVLLKYMPHIRAVMKPGATLLLSGILLEDAEIIVESCRQSGLQKVNILSRNGWIAIECQSI